MSLIASMLLISLLPTVAAMSTHDAAAKTETSLATQAEPRLRIAVYEFATQGVDARTARIVSESTVTELRKLKGLLVVSMEEVRAMLALETDKELAGCGDDSCLAEIGDALGVDGLVVGQLVTLDDGSVFILRRIDQKNAKVVGSVQKRLDHASGEEFLAAIGPSVSELFPEYAIRKGVQRGVDPQVALLVNPPPLSPWIFWTGFGSTVALASASSALGIFAVAARVQLGKLVKDARGGGAISGAEVVQRQQTITVFGWSAVGVGVGTLVGAGLSGALYPFTDFTGNSYDEDME